MRFPIPALALAASLIFCAACYAQSDMDKICATDKANVEPYKTVCPFILKDRAIKKDIDDKTRARFAEFGPEIAERAVEKNRTGKLRFVRGCFLFSEAVEDFNAEARADDRTRKSLKSCADIPNVFQASVITSVEAGQTKFHQLRLLIPSKKDPDDSQKYWMSDESYQRYKTD